MSTYIPGTTDYIPQIQPFRPDYNFYAGALQMKQSQYDQGYQQVSSLYGSLLNSPMLRDSNIKARDDYFQAVNRDIKKIAGLDLSKRENVNAASKVFSGLYENDNIVKDMVWTKNYQKELKRADGFKNCVKPEDCGGSYWEGGIKALNYRASEFRSATDEQALGFGNVSYTPYQNVMEKAIKAAKDAGLNITVDQLQGRYITTTKNGPMLIEPLQSLFTGVFGSDPAIMDYYKTKAYVDRKDWVQGNVPQYGSIEAAEQAYSEMAMQGLNALYGTSVEDLNARVDTVSGQKKQLEERIRKEGAVPDGNLAEQYRALNSMEETVQGSQRVYETSQNRYQNARDPQQLYLMGENLDQAMAYGYLSNDINQTAQTLAYKDYTFEMNADPYALENTKQANRMALEKKRYENRKSLIDHKFDLKKAEELQNLMGPETLPSFINVSGGSSEISEDNATALYNAFKDDEGNIVTDISQSEKTILTRMLTAMKEKSKGERRNGTSGFATDDLMKFADIMLTELTNPDAKYYREGDFVSNKEAYKANLEHKRKWDSMDFDQKVKYAHSMDVSRFITNPSLSGTVIDNIYEKYAEPLLDMNNGANWENRDYLRSLWEDERIQQMRYGIMTKGESLEQMGKWRIENANKTLADMGTSEEYSNWKPLMSMYIDPGTGSKRSAHEFASNFADNIVSQVQSDPEDVSYIGKGLGPYFKEPDYYYSLGMDIYNGVLNKRDDKDEVMIRSFLGIEFQDIRNSLSDGKGLDHVWAEAFSEYAEPDGRALGGLTGAGSKSSLGMRFNTVDAATIYNDGTLNTISFLSNVINVGTEGAVVAGGSPMASIEDVAGEMDLEGYHNTFVRQFYQDMLKKKDFDDDSRPISQITYQDVALGDDGWTAMHIVPNLPYINSLIETNTKPGILTKEQGDEIIKNGVTTYLRKADANNGFRKAVETTPIENGMFWSGEYKFDQYPDVTNDVKLTQNNNGDYVVTGSVFSYMGGKQDWENINFGPYQASQFSPDDIVNEVNLWLATGIVPDARLMNQQYNRENGTRDPASLLSQ